MLDVFELILEHASAPPRFVQQANNILSQYRRTIPHLHTAELLHRRRN
jgi:hypothetical protein